MKQGHVVNTLIKLFVEMGRKKVEVELEIFARKTCSSQPISCLMLHALACVFALKVII